MDSEYLHDGTAAAYYRGRLPFVAQSLAAGRPSDVVSFVASVTGKASDMVGVWIEPVTAQVMITLLAS